jgi:hypothetical protein
MITVIPSAIMRPKSPIPTAIGAKCSVKNLYEGPPKPQFPPGVINWIENYPDDIEESVECTLESQQQALLVRNKKCRGRKPFKIHSIDIQSPLLKRALEYVFGDYPGITPGLAHLSFVPPFEPFFYRWDRLQKISEDNQNNDQETLDHIQLLKKVLQEELQETFDTHNDLISHGVITFDFLWTLFPPGDLIFTIQDGQDQLEKVECSNYVESPGQGISFLISGYHVNCDGKRFGFEFFNVSLKSFTGTKPITDLKAYPLRFHVSAPKLQERLIQRGRHFEDLRGCHYKRYNELGQKPNQRLPVTGARDKHGDVSSKHS